MYAETHRGSVPILSSASVDLRCTHLPLDCAHRPFKYRHRALRHYRCRYRLRPTEVSRKRICQLRKQGRRRATFRARAWPCAPVVKAHSNAQAVRSTNLVRRACAGRTTAAAALPAGRLLRGLTAPPSPAASPNRSGRSVRLHTPFPIPTPTARPGPPCSPLAAARAPCRGALRSAGLASVA